MNTRFQITSGRRANDMDFVGNSLRFELEFEAGAYKKRYTWETKAGSKSADVTEPRDRARVNNKGNMLLLPQEMVLFLVQKWQDL